MDKFVCVRVVQGWGIDLSIFQFDYELTWAVFLMNADKTIYGRYGSRSDHKDTTKDVSIDGLKKAMEGALELHKGYPGNKNDLAGKTGPKPAFATPEAIPEISGKPFAKPADGTRAGCIHCHQATTPDPWTLRKSKQPIPDKTLWPYPMPNDLGLTLDPKDRATVTAVAKGTAAEKAGFKTGDKISRMEGQPILSIADVQWVLQNAKEPGSVKAEVDRGGQKTDLTMTLAAGWRHANDFSWRLVMWGMRHKLMGTEPLEVLPADERTKLGVADGAMALRIKGFPPAFVKDKNPDAPAKLQKGDVIVEADGRKDFLNESAFLAYLMQKKTPGQSVELSVLRGGKSEKISLTIP
jgi:serine protease Do